MDCVKEHFEIMAFQKGSEMYSKMILILAIHYLFFFFFFFFLCVFFNITYIVCARWVLCMYMSTVLTYYIYTPNRTSTAVAGAVGAATRSSWVV